MRVFALISRVCMVCALILSGCIRPAEVESTGIQTREIKIEKVELPEKVVINNCGGKADSEQSLIRAFTINIDGLPTDYKVLEPYILNKYSQYQKTEKAHKVVAPPGSNMEFELRWMEEIRTGTMKAGGEVGIYSVRFPLSVEQVSSRDQGCPQDSAPAGTPQQAPGAEPAAVADLPGLEETATPTPEAAATPTRETGLAITAKLKWCNDREHDPIVCLGSIAQTQESRQLDFIFKVLLYDPFDQYYLMMDDAKFPCTMDAVPERIYCLQLPPRIGEEVLLQLYSAKSTSPMAEGRFLLAKSYILIP